MKVTIIKKKTEPFKKLFVKTLEKEMYDAILARLKKAGATDDRITSFIKENDYNDVISYPFDLNCSKKTWAAVEKHYELDVKIDFGVNEKGYCTAKISIVDKVEQVLGYTPSGGSDEDVTEWACGAIPEAKKEEAKPVVEHVPESGSDLLTDDGLPF